MTDKEARRLLLIAIEDGLHIKSEGYWPTDASDKFVQQSLAKVTRYADGVLLETDAGRFFVTVKKLRK